MDPTSSVSQVRTSFIIKRVRAVKGLDKDLSHLSSLLERVESILVNGEVKFMVSTQTGLAVSKAVEGLASAAARLKRIILKMQDKGFLSKFCTATELTNKLRAALKQLQTSLETLTSELAAAGTKLSQVALNEMYDLQDAFHSTANALAGNGNQVDGLGSEMDGLLLNAKATNNILKGKLDEPVIAGVVEQPSSKPDKPAHAGVVRQQSSKQEKPVNAGPVTQPMNASPAIAPVYGRVYNHSQIAAATQGFTAGSKIGEGGFGSVYRGVLDGVAVAVKVMSTDPGALQGAREFMKEVSILSSLHHPHIVQLLGSCPEQHMLVYKLAEGGSLEDRLLLTSPSTSCQQKQTPLSWQARVRIAAEVAAALQYLHTAPDKIVHMDVNPRNILLTRHDTVKLGDVGLARFMSNHVPPHVAHSKVLQSSNRLAAPSAVRDSQIVGSFAYIDPEYMQTLMYSPSSDVFALGMVMLQLLTGMDVRQVHNEVEEAMDSQQISKVIDPKAGDWPKHHATVFASLALRCSEFKRRKRPDLGSVVLPQLLSMVPIPSQAPAQTQPTAQADSGKVPEMFLCPITQDIMLKPAIAADGHTYEWNAIKTWLSQHATSPLTNQVLQSKELLPNHLLRSAISEWLQLHPEHAGVKETKRPGNATPHHSSTSYMHALPPSAPHPQRSNTATREIDAKPPNFQPFGSTNPFGIGPGATTGSTTASHATGGGGFDDFGMLLVQQADARATAAHITTGTAAAQHHQQQVLNGTGNAAQCCTQVSTMPIHPNVGPQPGRHDKVSAATNHVSNPFGVDEWWIGIATAPRAGSQANYVNDSGTIGMQGGMGAPVLCTSQTNQQLGELQSLMTSNPQGAVAFAKMIAKQTPPPLVASTVADMFQQRDMIREATEFLMDVLAANRPEQAALQTKLLEINFIHNPNIADAILANRTLTCYDKSRIAQLCEKAGLYMRALQHYTALPDIKRCITNTHAIDAQALTIYLGTLSKEWLLECMKELLISNHHHNLQLVVNIAKQYTEQLTSASIIKLLHSSNCYHGLYFYLRDRIAISEDPEEHYQYIETAARVGQIKEVERMTREGNVYPPDRVRAFLMEAKLPDARSLVTVCDRFDMVEELTQYLYTYNMLPYIGSYLSHINPSKAPQVVCALLDCGASEEFINNVIIHVRSQLPVHELLEVVEGRGRLQMLAPFLEHLIQYGSTDAHVHNAWSKIKLQQQ